MPSLALRLYRAFLSKRFYRAFLSKFKMPSPVHYDMFEQVGSSFHPIPVLMAFKPVSYQLVNFPIHVDTEIELARYVDHNYEGEVPGLYFPGANFPPVGYINKFTHDENDLINSVRDIVVNLTRRRFARPIRPATNLLVQSGPFRMIKGLGQATGKGNLSVFEIGPGAGYLGAMLAMSGHRYLSYDVTQAWYLWQNRLLAAVSNGNFAELASSPKTPTNLPQVTHIPWWIFASYLTGCPIRVDMVYSNSNLCEMSPLALKMALTISREMLSESSVGLFTFFSHGMPAQTEPEALEGIFNSVGYIKVLDKPFQAYALNPSNVTEALKFFDNGIPHYDPTSRGGELEANDVVSFRRDEAPLDTTVTTWNLGWVPPFKKEKPPDQME